MQDGYARNLNLANAGFTDGPCLVKDTMQLKYFTKFFSSRFCSNEGKREYSKFNNR